MKRPRATEIDAANYLMCATLALPANISHEFLKDMILHAYLRGRQDEAADRDRGPRDRS